MKEQPISIFLMGPTASGKTALAMQLMRCFPCEIISVDSGMIYKGMDIGTAKPTLIEQKTAPHLLIDICDASQTYSAAQFREDALTAIRHAFQKNKIPLLVGGTSLYFHVLKYGLSEMPNSNNQIREELKQQAQKIGWHSLYDRLKAVDPIAAHKIHPHDTQRIQRALTLYLSTGKTRTEWWTQPQQGGCEVFTILPIVLMPSDRQILHRAIEMRFYEMLRKGFLEEVEYFYQRGDLSLEKPSMRMVGYRQIWEYFSGEKAHQEMIETSIYATRQLAKRQMTWLRRWVDAKWFDSQDPQLLNKVKSHIST